MMAVTVVNQPVPMERTHAAPPATSAPTPIRAALRLAVTLNTLEMDGVIPEPTTPKLADSMAATAVNQPATLMQSMTVDPLDLNVPILARPRTTVVMAVTVTVAMAMAMENFLRALKDSTVHL